METTLIKGRDFIIFGLQPWDITIGSNCKNIALEISKYNRVLYVNRPLDRISYIKKADNAQVKNRISSIKKGINTLDEVENQLWVFNPRVILESINFLPKGFFYRYLNKRNNKKLGKEITWAKDQLNLKDPILIIDNDFFNGLYLSEFIKPRLFIYYIRDFLLSQKYFVKHGYSAEPLIMQKASAVAANSRYLTNYAANYNPNSFDIGQGCDVEDFLLSPSEFPSDIKNIKYPIIGYCGSLTSTRLDLNLIEFIATYNPDWNIVLVGPEDDAFRTSKLHQLNNVHFLGPKPPSQLPSYTHAFDVCINPQLVNPMTIGNYPRKVDEYLAAGKPVVATKTEAMEMFAHVVSLCNSKEEFVKKINDALVDVRDARNEHKIAERKSFAESHTWAASVNQLYKLINKLY